MVSTTTAIKTSTASTAIQTDVVDMPPFTEGDMERAISSLLAVKKDVQTRILGRDQEIELLLCCLLCQEHMLLLGPPGTAKSLLMEEVSQRILLPDGSAARTFKLLLNKFTAPEALLGPISVSLLKQDIYQHITTGSFAECHIALLDEIYRASSALLNSLLLAINERAADVGTGRRVSIPLQTMICASNDLPQDMDALGAFHDRLLVRISVGYLERDTFIEMMSEIAKRGSRFGRAGTPPAATMQAADLSLLQEALGWVEVPPPVVGALDQIRTKLTEQGIINSDRRWGQVLGLLRAHALINGRGVVDDDDLMTCQFALWNTLDQVGKVKKEIARASNPATAKITEKLDAASGTFTSFQKAYQTETNAQAKYALCTDAMQNLKAAKKEIQAVLDVALGKKEVSVAAKAQAALEQIQGWSLVISEKIIGD